jgi:hypothetical protein
MPIYQNGTFIGSTGKVWRQVKTHKEAATAALLDILSDHDVHAALRCEAIELLDKIKRGELLPTTPRFNGKRFNLSKLTVEERRNRYEARCRKKKAILQNQSQFEKLIAMVAVPEKPQDARES